MKRCSRCEREIAEWATSCIECDDLELGAAPPVEATAPPAASIARPAMAIPAQLAPPSTPPALPAVPHVTAPAAPPVAAAAQVPAVRTHPAASSLPPVSLPTSVPAATPLAAPMAARPVTAAPAMSAPADPGNEPSRRRRRVRGRHCGRRGLRRVDWCTRIVANRVRCHRRTGVRPAGRGTRDPAASVKEGTEQQLASAHGPGRSPRRRRRLAVVRDVAIVGTGRTGGGTGSRAQARRTEARAAEAGRDRGTSGDNAGGCANDDGPSGFAGCICTRSAPSHGTCTCRRTSASANASARANGEAAPVAARRARAGARPCRR